MKLGCLPAAMARLKSRGSTPRPSAAPAAVSTVAGLRADDIVDAAVRVAHRGTVPRALLDTRNNRVTSIEVQGDAIFGRHAELIRQAQSEVLLQTYALEPRSPSITRFIAPALFDLQEARRARGESGPPIRVRILSNELGGFAALFMAKKGDRTDLSPRAVLGFEPDPAHLDVEIAVNRAVTTDAIHTKCLVVDERRAMTCGANIQSRNHPDPSAPEKVPQYDYGVAVEGEVATALREAFRSVWAGAQARPGDGPARPATPLAPSAGALARQKGRKRPPRGARAGADAGATRIAVVSRRSEGIGSMLTRPFRPSTPQSRAMLSAIDRAERRVSIMTPNLNEPEVVDALVAAARRDVAVEVVLSKGFNDSREAKPLCGGTNTQTVHRLYARVPDGAPLDVRWFTLAGERQPVFGQREGVGASHAKFLVVDEAVAFTGSANLDKQSWRFANETTLAIFDEDVSKAMLARVFDPVFDRSVPARPGPKGG